MDGSDFWFFYELPVEVSTKSKSTFHAELDALVRANTNRSVWWNLLTAHSSNGGLLTCGSSIPPFQRESVNTHPYVLILHAHFPGGLHFKLKFIFKVKAL